MDKHLDFNTDFLNETVSPKTGSGQQPIAKKPGKSWNWKKILGIALGVYVLFAIIASFSDDSSTSSSTSTSSITNSSNTTEDLVTTGRYSCTRYNHDRAGDLEPSISELESLKSTENLLSSQGDTIDEEKGELEIENDYVDQYSQSSIDAHNAKIDAFNAKLEGWRYKVKNNSNAIDSYNARVETYNNFLIANCTPN